MPIIEHGGAQVRVCRANLYVLLMPKSTMQKVQVPLARRRDNDVRDPLQARRIGEMEFASLRDFHNGKYVTAQLVCWVAVQCFSSPFSCRTCSDNHGFDRSSSSRCVVSRTCLSAFSFIFHYLGSMITANAEGSRTRSQGCPESCTLLIKDNL